MFIGIKHKLTKKSKFLILLSIPILLLSTLIGVFVNYFTSNNKEVSIDEKKYEYDYEYDDNWEELIAHSENDDESDCCNGCKG